MQVKQVRCTDPIGPGPSRFSSFWCFVAALLVIVCVGCSESNRVINPTPQTVFGSGVVVSEARTIAGCAGVSLAAPADVHIEQGAQETLRVEAEDNILPHVKTRVQAGILMIETDAGVQLRPTQPIDLYLTVLSLDEITHIGVGEIEGIDLTLNRLALTHTGVGEIRIDNLDLVELDAMLSGVGDVQLSGTTSRQAVRVLGVGDYEAENLSSSVAEVTLEGNRSATVRVSTSLDVTITGSGAVYYYGDPTVTRTINGTGSVVRLGP